MQHHLVGAHIGENVDRDVDLLFIGRRANDQAKERFSTHVFISTTSGCDSEGIGSAFFKTKRRLEGITKIASPDVPWQSNAVTELKLRIEDFEVDILEPLQIVLDRHLGKYEAISVFIRGTV